MENPFHKAFFTLNMIWDGDMCIVGWLAETFLSASAIAQQDDATTS
ncbi:MAG: hypothetical protein F6K42_12550 [Leptolyngbya sp. SIO1D8]|nr:hypothetical protein [Leptolyngbya sp. SIO1D8]